MKKRNIGLAPFGYSPGMSERYIFILKKFKFQICREEEFKFFSNVNTIFITDTHKLISYFRIAIYLFCFPKIKVIFYCTELYYYSINAAISELMNNNISLGSLKATIYRILQILMLKFINFKSKFYILNCSYERLKYLNIVPSSYFLNLPFKVEVKKKKFYKLNSKKFVYLPGNINDNVELEKVCKFCESKGLNLVISTGNKIKNKILKKYSNLIELTGNIDMKHVTYILQKAEYGLCIYNNNNINQNYASSLKVHLFLNMKKKIIFSDVIGNRFLRKISNCISIDNLKKIKKIKKKNNLRKYKIKYFEDNFNNITNSNLYKFING